MRTVLKRVIRAVAFKMPAWGYTVSSALIVGILYLTALTPAPALALPEGRHYELVSPVFKGGYRVNALVAVAPDGESAVFESLGAFAGDPTDSGIENDYFARRVGGVGWSVAPLSPPASIAPKSQAADFSPALDTSLDAVGFGPNLGGAVPPNGGFEKGYLVHSTVASDSAPNAPGLAPNFELAGMVLKALDKGLDGSPPVDFHKGASADFSHIVFENISSGNEQFLSEAAKSKSRLYELARSSPCGVLGGGVCMEAPPGGGAGGEPASLRLVGLNNKGNVLSPSCQPALGESGGGELNAVSADGSELFFETTLAGGCSSESQQLFVRLGGGKTLEVSRPLGECKEVPCAGAVERGPARFRGASQDGSRVFFTSTLSSPTKPLVPGDTDLSRNLYMASIRCPAPEPGCEPAKREVTGLAQVSHDPNAGEAAEVRDVVAVAPDGSRVYFVARGDLLGATERGVLAGEGRALPVAGADNLYVYDSLTGATGFIADLCSGSGESGAIGDLRCPSGLEGGESEVAKNDTPLWAAVEREAHLNVCGSSSASECVGRRESGRFLVFASYAQLTADDTDAAKDVYHYDALTGSLVRVSVGEAGHAANGNGGFDATLTPSHAVEGKTLYEQRELQSRAVTEDGSRVVFTTAEPLSPAAVNGLANAYEWHEGSVSLLSSGSATSAVENPVISSSGRDVFFTTTQGLVPQDTDGQTDLYDARLGEGFPPAPVEPQPCSGDACQGSLTSPAPLLIPGSVSQAPGQNFAAPTPAVTVKPKPKKKPKKKKRKAKARKAATKRGAK